MRSRLAVGADRSAGRPRRWRPGPVVLALPLWLIALALSVLPAAAHSPGNAYVANGGSANVSQYAIGAGGALSPLTPATVAAGSLLESIPFGVVVAPDGKSAYVTDLLGNTVLQYDVDSVTGALSPKTPATVPAGAGSFRVAMTSDGRSAYVINFDDNTVSQYTVDRVSGALSPKTPATVATGASPAGIAVRPLARVPTSKEQCKHGGWRNFPQFRNQGDCVSFVETGK